MADMLTDTIAYTHLMDKGRCVLCGKTEEEIAAAPGTREDGASGEPEGVQGPQGRGATPNPGSLDA